MLKTDSNFYKFKVILSGEKCLWKGTSVSRVLICIDVNKKKPKFYENILNSNDTTI